MSSSADEHWRTICVCSVCGQTPETAPLFKCKVGHKYCGACYDDLESRSRDGQRVCTLCGSPEFSVDQKGSDFLKKLRTKPGIGRPYRYKLNPESKVVSYAQLPSVQPSEDNMTVEQLFRLHPEDLKQLFAEQTRERLREDAPFKPRDLVSKCSIQGRDLDRGENPSSVWLSQSNYQTLGKSFSQSNAFSKKPLKCPHAPCNKTVAVSSFLTHFKHEHPEIPRYNVDRGNQLVIPCDASMIEHDVTFCLALLTVYDMTEIRPSPKAPPNVTKACNKMNSRVPFSTFWLLVSGSPSQRSSSAYAIYWLLTCNASGCSCTLEMASSNDSTSCSSFCGVNGNNESQDIDEVAGRLNCLFLTKGSLSSLLEDGPDLKLGITIH